MATVWGPNVVANPVELTLRGDHPDETVNWSVAHLSMLRGSIMGLSRRSVSSSLDERRRAVHDLAAGHPAASPVLITLPRLTPRQSLRVTPPAQRRPDD